jgi:Spy/CpxP family protein refolding chaperone
MKGKFHLRAICIILGVWVLLPSLPLVQAKEGGWERMKEKVKIVKDLGDLKLAPEKKQELLAVEEKYAKERKDIVAALKKYREDLEAALAAPTPDEAKIKDLISAANAAQDKLLTSFKMERDEMMALMTPIQQAQFIIGMDNRFQKIVGNGKFKESKKGQK